MITEKSYFTSGAIILKTQCYCLWRVVLEAKDGGKYSFRTLQLLDGSIEAVLNTPLKLLLRAQVIDMRDSKLLQFVNSLVDGRGRLCGPEYDITPNHFSGLRCDRVSAEIAKIC